MTFFLVDSSISALPCVSSPWYPLVVVQPARSPVNSNRMTHSGTVRLPRPGPSRTCIERSLPIFPVECLASLWGQPTRRLRPKRRPPPSSLNPRGHVKGLIPKALQKKSLATKERRTFTNLGKKNFFLMMFWIWTPEQLKIIKWVIS